MGLRGEMNGTEARWINIPEQNIELNVPGKGLFVTRRLEMKQKKKKKKKEKKNTFTQDMHSQALRDVVTMIDCP